MHTVRPLDKRAVLTAARETRAMATIEEHSVLGGLGGAVAEILAEADGANVSFTRIGVESAFAPTAGDQEYLRDVFGLSTDAAVERLKMLVA